jgi:hypothetical protein
MDADQLDLKITGHVTTIIEMPYDAEAPVVVCLAALAAAVIRLDEELAP